MKTIVPEQLSFAAQPVDWQGRLHQSFTLGLGFDLLTGRTLTPDAAWGAAMQALEGGGLLDTGLPKKEAEWLLAGKACAPEGAPATSLVVDMRVGASSRRLLAEREQPFAALPLTWENTWGTEQENPQGLPPTQVRRAPVTDASSPFGTPACPGPRGAWPCRMQRMGTYNAAWLKNRWPGVPDDFDWAFYNLAQPCQRLPQGIRGDEDFELTGLHPRERRIRGHLPGKTLRLFVQRQGQWHEHAIHADTVWLFPNQLTGLVLWHAMAECTDESGTDIEAVRVELTPEDAPPAEEKPAPAAVAPTPEPAVPEAPAAEPSAPAAMSAMAAGGVAATAPQVVPEAPAPPPPTASEPPAAEPPTDYKAAFSQALDENLDEINAGLAEAGLPPLTPEQVAETRQRLDAMAEQMQAMEAQIAATPEPDLADVLRKAGVSETDIKNVHAALDLPQPDPALCRTPEEWHAAVETYLGLFAGLMHPSESTLNTMRTTLRLQGPGGEEVLEQLAGGPPPKPEDVLAKAGMAPDRASKFLELLDGDIPSDPEGMKAFATQLEQAGGFPPGSVSGKIEAYHAALKEMGFELPAAVPDIPETAEPPAAEPAEPEPEAPEAAPSPEAAAPPGAVPPTDRESVLAWLAEGKSLAGLSLRGADLSGLDLSGQDMRGVDLSGGSLAGAQLKGADLSGARLAQTNCADAVFSEAVLVGASLAGAAAAGALFLRADLTGANAEGMKAADADFSEAVLNRAVLAKGSFANATFQRAQGEGCDARGADLNGAKLRFCTMPGALFANASLTGADVHECALEKADFSNAVLDKASFCYGTSVAGANLAGASLQGGVWTQVSARGTVFTGCRAAGASFSDGDYTAAVWRGADLRSGDFSRSVLSGADMEGANLFRASLREAELSAARLRGANLYGVDMTRVKMDPGTNLDGADLTNTILAAREKAQ
ncbi:MAG: pentapeptide repeat-containing protein [bacterium]|nr:pentapeptide repeat-containing protein [bacterium]